MRPGRRGPPGREYHVDPEVFQEDDPEVGAEGGADVNAQNHGLDTEWCDAARVPGWNYPPHGTPHGAAGEHVGRGGVQGQAGGGQGPSGGALTTPPRRRAAAAAAG